MSRNTIHFLGITTTGSAIRRVFPAWMHLLDTDAALATLDLPADSPPAPYRSFLTAIRDDPDSLGAVITAHKTAVHDHGAHLFAHLDRDSERFHEISVITRRDDGLSGAVIEPTSIATTLGQMGNLEPLTSPDRDVVIFGVGGTAVSLLAVLASDTWPADRRPRRVHLVDVAIDRLQHAHNLATSGLNPLQVEVLHSPGTIHLSHLGNLPAGSLIINATGLGKDRPGAPFELPARWPLGAHIWDLNYRGDLILLDEARRAPVEKQLTPHDGWLLFINGWAEALSRILDRPIDHPTREHMNQLAQEVRTP